MALSITRRLLTYFGGVRVDLGAASMTSVTDDGFWKFHNASAGGLICPVCVTTGVADHFITNTVSATAWAASYTITGVTATAGIPRYVAWGV